MKSRFVAVFTMLLVCFSALAEDEFRPLSNIHPKGKGGLLYVMKRCAAVSLFMSNAIKNSENSENNSDAFVLSETLMDRYKKFSQFALSVQISILNDQNKEISSPIIDEIISDIGAMVNYYKKDGDKSYQLTGKTISDLVTEDTIICTDVTTKDWFNRN